MRDPGVQEIDEPNMDELEQGLRAAGLPKALPLEYAQRRSASAPFDWESSIRQFIFAAGAGFVAGAAADVYGNAWKDNEVLWIGFGTAMMALTLPWPGRIGRRRD